MSIHRFAGGRIVPVLFAVAVLGGCNQGVKPMYHWGSYQAQVYGYFEGNTGPEEQIAALEAEVEKARSAGETLPPGFRAHLGMLYARVGKTDAMAEMFSAEKQAYPESAGYMDFLMRNANPQVSAQR